MASDGRSPSAARPPGGPGARPRRGGDRRDVDGTDLGTGQPLEHGLRTAILAVRLGELAGLSPPELVDACCTSLLHSIGTSDATEQTELFGDDIEPRAKFALVDGGNPEEAGAFLMDVVGAGQPPGVREAMVSPRSTTRARRSPCTPCRARELGLPVGRGTRSGDGLDDALIWEQAVVVEPPPQRWMTGDEIDAAFRVIGTFTETASAPSQCPADQSI
jgi:hypothetical protein